MSRADKEKPPYPRFGAFVSAAMKVRMLTGVEVAERLGVRPATVTAWKQGLYRPEERERLEQLSEILGLETDVLWSADNPLPPPTPFDGLNPLVQEAVQRHLDKVIALTEQLAVELTSIYASVPPIDPVEIARQAAKEELGPIDPPRLSSRPRTAPTSPSTAPTPPGTNAGRTGPVTT